MKRGKPQTLRDIQETQEREMEKRLEKAAHFAKYPMCTKLSSVHNDKAIIDCFLEWLEENDLAVCQRAQDGGRYRSDKSNGKLLMEYFGIDEKQLEEERRKILEEQRKRNEQA